MSKEKQAPAAVNKAAFLAAVKPKLVTREVKEMGGATVTFRRLSLAQSRAGREYAKTDDGKIDQEKIMAHMVACCVVDQETGQSMFASADEVIALEGELEQAAYLELINICNEVNGYIEKASTPNPSTTPANGSPSA